MMCVASSASSASSVVPCLISCTALAATLEGSAYTPKAGIANDELRDLRVPPCSRSAARQGSRGVNLLSRENGEVRMSTTWPEPSLGRPSGVPAAPRLNVLREPAEPANALKKRVLGVVPLAGILLAGPPAWAADCADCVSPASRTRAGAVLGCSVPAGVTRTNCTVKGRNGGSSSATPGGQGARIWRVCSCAARPRP